MKTSTLNLFLLLTAISGFTLAQVPTANFIISPNPVCSGSTNVVQITDNSSGSPNSWSYTVQAGGAGPGGAPTILTSQNPTLSFNFQGTYTITLVATNSSGASLPVSYTLLVLPSPNSNINPATQTTCIGSNPVNISVTIGGGPGGGGVNSYSWSTGSTASLISVSPSVSTTYSCLITATNGCSVLRTANITIAAASVSITSNPINICPGTSSTLTASGSAPGPFTYTWSNSITTRTLSTALAGVYDVTVTNSNGCSAIQSYTLGTSTTLSLTATSTPSVLCAGNTATVRVTGAATYTWSTGAVTANASVNPIANTTYTVQGVIGICSGTAAITISVNMTPTLLIGSSSVSLCAGESATLNASGANTYTWLPSTISESLVITPSAGSSYTVRGNNPGCPNRTATISILVIASPTLVLSTSSNVICAGEYVAIAASGADNYFWSNGSNSALLLVSPSVSTTYSVTGYYNQNSCGTKASILQIVNACTGINADANSMEFFTVYPNPVSDGVTISSDLTLKVTLVNYSGQVIKKFELNEWNHYSYRLDDLSEGIYFVNAQNSERNLIKKIVVLK
jgi:hypothetical protein